MIRGLFARPGERPVPVDSAAEIGRLRKEGGGVLWVDLEMPGEPEHELLTGVFGFHDLAVQHCKAETSHARLHEYGDYLYLVFHAVKGVLPLAMSELDVFLGTDFLVTYHRDPLPTLVEIRKRVVDVERVVRGGPDRILAEILDELAEGYVESMEQLDVAVDGLEARLFKHASRMALRDAFALKKDVLHLRRLVGPQREILHRLSRGEFKLVTADDALLFRDVHDRILRVAEMLESFRDLVSSAMEVYLTVVSNRTNEIVKVLTIVSIVLMSLSFVAGLYGMNVKLPGADPEKAGTFYVLLLIMTALAGGLLLIFRRRKWI